MKNLTLILILAFFSIQLNLIQAQDYTPFYMDNAVWTMERIIPDIGPEDDHEFWQIYTLDDTLINNKTYRKVATKNLCRQFQNNYGELNYDNSIHTGEFIFGGIREENKKVYFQRFDVKPEWQLLQYRFGNLSLDEEHLLLDFNFSPGDTTNYSDLTSFSILNGDTTYNTSSYFSIDREQISPVHNHQRYRVSNSTAYAFPEETADLIEGIGSEYGFFGSYNSYFTYLNCFSVNEEPLIYTSGCLPCAGFVSSDTNPLAAEEVEIYPNPTNSHINLISTANSNISQIRILDSTGKMMRVKKYSASNLQIDFSEFPLGVYFLQIQFENGYEKITKIILN